MCQGHMIAGVRNTFLAGRNHICFKQLLHIDNRKYGREITAKGNNKIRHKLSNYFKYLRLITCVM
jgi:hypothetical protein